jgi:hypothetical protein
MTFTFQSLNMIKKNKINSTMPIVMIFIVNTNFEKWKTKINDKNSHSQNLTHQRGNTKH